jgi:F0F1-type ATP synthase beta subunit
MDWTNAFANTKTTKLFLDEAKKFWIEVRDELGHDESRAIALASIRGVSRTTTGEESDKLVEVDLGAGADRKVLTYLVDWNLVDAQGKTIDVTSEALKRDALKHLKPEHYKAIEATIDAHVLERAGKKPMLGTLPSDPTSS